MGFGAFLCVSWEWEMFPQTLLSSIFPKEKKSKAGNGKKLENGLSNKKQFDSENDMRIKDKKKQFVSKFRVVA